MNQVQVCMVDGCKEEKVPDLIFCREHADEFFRGERKAPQIRTHLDYVSHMRKTFLITEPNKQEK